MKISIERPLRKICRNQNINFGDQPWLNGFWGWIRFIKKVRKFTCIAWSGWDWASWSNKSVSCTRPIKYVMGNSLFYVGNFWMLSRWITSSTTSMKKYRNGGMEPVSFLYFLMLIWKIMKLLSWSSMNIW